MGTREDIVAYVEETVRQCVGSCGAESVLAAVSGGQDSVAMMLALAALRERSDLRLEAGHVNHGLRGAQSDQDEEFVRRLAGDLDVPVHVERLDMAADGESSGGGLEATARRKRFSALRSMATTAGLQWISLGHTATDRAETVLMNILRGSGLEGLAAMRQVAGDLIRPVLQLTRADTEAYCGAKGIAPRRDSSNLDQTVLRNRVRLSLMPLLDRDYQPGVERALLRLAEVVEGELEWTGPLIERAHAEAATRDGGAVRLNLRKLQGMPPGLRRRVLRLAVADVRGDVQNLGLAHFRGLDELIVSGQTGSRAELPGVRAERTAEEVVLGPPRTGRQAEYCVSLRVPGKVGVAEAGIELSSILVPVRECDAGRRGPMRAHLDAAQVGRELVVRSRRPGDRIAPLGMRGSKKLQDLLVDKKIPRAEREGVPVVATTNGEIVWIVGHRISERAKVTAQTELVAELEARPLA